MAKTSLLLIAVYALALPAGVSAQEEFRPEWFQCSADNECAVTKGYCGNDWAVNKESLAAVGGFVSQWTSCEQSGTHNPNAMAKCEAGKCIVKLAQPSKNASTRLPGAMR